jgi:Ca2+-binding RTX toxin-like protein
MLDVANNISWSYIEGDARSSGQVRLKNITLSKYKFEDVNNKFSLSLSGNITEYQEHNFGIPTNQYIKFNLNNVKLIFADFNFTTAKISYIKDKDLDIDVHRQLMSGLAYATFDYNNSVNIASLKDYIMERVYPNLIKGDNAVNIITKNGFELNAGEGNDTIIGGVGNDTIIGGAGSDKLTGGKGIDVFSFSKSDFFTDNSNGIKVYNKSVDTITDFNVKEGDLLDFDDLGQLEFYANLKDAQESNAHLFFIKGSNKVYLNTDTTDSHYNATIIITLTGKTEVNTELTNFNYPIL